MGIGDAYGIENAGADYLFRRQGHDDGERDVFQRFRRIFCLLARQ